MATDQRALHVMGGQNVAEKRGARSAEEITRSLIIVEMSSQEKLVS